ncbi:MAG: hypothetical protein P1U57_09705, partial [Oleibacter sp.]|nr:hypothetical protein [Thalassolituus sp.]
MKKIRLTNTTRQIRLAMLASLVATPFTAMASPSIGGGVWFNYANEIDSQRDKETLGTLGDEAVILYFDDQREGTPWSFSGEVRYGPGAFTSAANNSSGDNFGLHKAWVGYQLTDNSNMKVGKSQVPFGWKNSNFWPGDALMGGYGDQMDVGVKYSVVNDMIDYNLAYYHADDWGKTSTDTMDDNGHWGSSTTYRKIQTVVADAAFKFAPNQQVGASAQAGKLEDLTIPSGSDANAVTGNHSAVAVYYQGDFNELGLKAQYTVTKRSLPDAYAASVALDETVKNDRAAIELSWTQGNYFFYLDANWAMPDSDGNNADTVAAYVPGVSYKYGPGWIYLEYLTQDGGIDANGRAVEGDYKAMYAT